MIIIMFRLSILVLSSNKFQIPNSDLNRLVLKVRKTEAEDDGTYTCEATKGGVTATDDFSVTVVGPKICEHENGHTWEEGDIYSLSEVRR